MDYTLVHHKVRSHVARIEEGMRSFLEKREPVFRGR